MPGPVRSMTGAGTAAIDDPSLGRFEAEARSVNHRFLKTTSRAMGPLPPLDGALEDLVRSRVERGHVTVTVRWSPAATGLARVDDRAFEAAAERLSDLAARHGLAAPAVGEVLSVPGVVAEARSAEESANAATRATEAVGRALEEMEASRTREGEHLRQEMRALLDAIAGATDAIARCAAEVPDAQRKRLESRLQELLASTGVAVDPAQVVRECALLADRSDVREELARLGAHVDHARGLLAEGGALGRRLDFLVQEMHREANTIGSKSSDLDVTRAVMDLKTHVERLREQAQNVE
jgi:uncharacterized protein (TIGR00255 family)